MPNTVSDHIIQRLAGDVDAGVVRGASTATVVADGLAELLADVPEHV